MKWFWQRKVAPEMAKATKEIRFESDTGHPTVGEFTDIGVRERKPKEPVHYHDDSHDPADWRGEFTAFCGKCKQQLNKPGLYVWTNRSGSWEEHPNKCS